MFGFILLIIVGAIVGAIAKFIHPGKDPGGFLGTILVGIGGSYLGSFLAKIIPFIGAEFGGTGLGSLIMAVVGAVILLFLYRRFVK